MLGPMSRQNVDTRSPRILGQCDIVRVIAHDERFGQVYTVRIGSVLQEVRVGLDAHTPILSAVRAAVDIANHDSVPPQVGNDVIVHPCDLVGTHEPGGDAGLMRHDEKAEMLLQSCESRYGIRKEHNLGGRPKMAAVLDDRAVPIQEYRWQLSHRHYPADPPANTSGAM